MFSNNKPPLLQKAFVSMLALYRRPRSTNCNLQRNSFQRLQLFNRCVAHASQALLRKVPLRTEPTERRPCSHGIPFGSLASPLHLSHLQASVSSGAGIRRLTSLHTTWPSCIGALAWLGQCVSRISHPILWDENYPQHEWEQSGMLASFPILGHA